MPRPFNRLPRGLLSFLDGKVPSAQNPQDLSDVMQASLDLRPFYEAAMREALTGVSLAIVAVGPVFFNTGSLSGTVPQDELWLVDQFSIQSQPMGAGEALNIIPIHRVGSVPVGSLQDQFLHSLVVYTLAVGQQAFSHAERPILLLPGDSLGFQVTVRTAYGGTVQGVANVCRLKI